MPVTTLPAAYPPVVYVRCADHTGPSWSCTPPATAAPRCWPTRRSTGCTPAGATYPWVAVRTQDLEQAHRRHPFDLLLLDVALPVHARRPA